MTTAVVEPVGVRLGALFTVSELAVVAIGVLLTLSALGTNFGFTPLPWQFFAALVAMTVAYPVLVEITKRLFYLEPVRLAGQPHRTRGRRHWIHRRAARFSYADRIPSEAAQQ
jgi:P-type Mg2+ transporter